MDDFSIMEAICGADCCGVCDRKEECGGCTTVRDILSAELMLLLNA